jgi:UDP-GlcNAc:undecaprenyl-phosphate GlcNAc-1-phosphate transferase
MLVLLVLGAAFAWLAISLLRPVAPALGLIDAPGGPNGRKTHKAPTPVVGGVGIALGLAAGLAFTGAAAGAPPSLLLAMAATVLLGAADDRSDLPKALRFLVQLAIGCAVAVAAGVDDLRLVHAVLGAPVPEAVAVILAGVAICALITAVNWFDGIDGMLGVLVLVTLAVGYFLAGPDEPALRALLQLTAGAVLAFLWFNLRRPGRERAVVFLGDAGSGLLAVVLGYLMLVLAVRKGQDPLLLVAAGNGLFFADMAFVIGLRLLTHGRPWQCDRTHLHHRLTDRGFSVTEIVLAAAGAHALYLSIPTVALAFAPALAPVLPFVLALTMLIAAVLAGRRAPPRPTAP